MYTLGLVYGLTRNQPGGLAYVVGERRVSSFRARRTSSTALVIMGVPSAPDWNLVQISAAVSTPRVVPSYVKNHCSTHGRSALPPGLEQLNYNSSLKQGLFIETYLVRESLKDVY